jgi:hypothetical protein
VGIGEDQPAGWDLFISYTQADRAWAEWIAWVLEEDGHRVLLQAWDFVPDNKWVQGMQTGVARAARTIAVLSSAYLQTQYGTPEWQTAWPADTADSKRKLLVTRVMDCDRPGFLAGVVSVDLFGITEAEASARLRAMASSVMSGRAKPAKAPAFPGRAVAREPRFPGAPPHVKVPVRDVPTRFAVAFSLAGEQRQIVLPIAQEVEAILGRSTVFYDDWYEHWIAGLDADLLLQKLYREGSELVVVCVSGSYGDKPWTRTEHRAVRARLMHEAKVPDRHRVLPIRVGDGEVEGILLNEIVPDFRCKTAAEAAELIVARLNLVRASADDVEPAVAHWPSDAPVLQWPMADHGEARRAFSNLLSEAAPERVLLVRGASETGKSHMSKQMIRNATLLPGVVSGRFDFKGTTSMGIEIEAFSQPLGIEPPAGQTLSERLAKIFTELRRRTQPTLLVFDTYEAAGEVTDWIESVLLPHVVSARWLRIVIIGQSTPSRVATIWESVAAGPITLQLPSPEDWLVYGRTNLGETLGLEFVAQAHQYAAGKPSLLAGLLGPRS